MRHTQGFSSCVPLINVDLHCAFYWRVIPHNNWLSVKFRIWCLFQHLKFFVLIQCMKKYLLKAHFIIRWSELLNSLQHLYKPFTFPYKIRACLIDFLNKISHEVELVLQRIYYFLHFFRMFWCLNFHISSTNWCCLWTHSQSNRSMLMVRDPDRLRLVWPSFPSPSVWCAIVKISVMQQYLAAWTQFFSFYTGSPSLSQEPKSLPTGLQPLINILHNKLLPAYRFV